MSEPIFESEMSQRSTERTGKEFPLLAAGIQGDMLVIHTKKAVDDMSKVTKLSVIRVKYIDKFGGMSLVRSGQSAAPDAGTILYFSYKSRVRYSRET